MDELIQNIKEAVTIHFEDAPMLPEILLLSELSLAYGALTPS